MLHRHRRIRSLPFLLALTVLAGAPTLGLADEWVRFHDGRFLKVQGHERLEGAVRLRLAGGAWVMVPEGQVEAIEARTSRTAGLPTHGAAQLVVEKESYASEMTATARLAAGHVPRIEAGQ